MRLIPYLISASRQLTSELFGDSRVESHSGGPGRRLRYLRLRSGFSEFQLAMRLGLPPETFWDLEDDDEAIFSAVTVGDLIRLSLLIGCDPAYLLGVSNSRRERCTVPENIPAVIASVKESEISRLNIIGLAELCEEHGASWVDVLRQQNQLFRGRQRVRLCKSIAALAVVTAALLFFLI